jgi:hypothetical protein
MLGKSRGELKSSVSLRSMSAKFLISPVYHTENSRNFRHSRTDTEDIKFIMKKDQVLPMIKSATLERLVERITYEKYPDTDLTMIFLLTYRSFTTSAKFFSLLIER